MLLIVICMINIPVVLAWPVYLHFGTGETQGVKVKGKEYRITLEQIEYITVPNNRKPASIGARTLQEAKVTLSVNGETITLTQRPYQLPVDFMGLRLYVENTRDWVKKAGKFQAVKHFPKDAKIALTATGEPWGPDTMRFPVLEYRWRSSNYNNTWSSLVPGKNVYYHRGEDFGLAPDRYHIQAILDGVVQATPLPDGDGASNEIIVKHSDDFSYRVSHVNTGTVKENILKGKSVKTGQLLAQGGRTYKGKEKMNNPHLHINFIYRGEAVSTYPYLVEAYMREYPDNVLAVAGGIQYASEGKEVNLDASRSVVREGHSIQQYIWELPNGKTLKGEKQKIVFDKAGSYPVTLRIQTDAGDEDTDNLQVYVLNEKREFNDFLGYFYTNPMRLRVKEEFTLWRPWRKGWANKPLSVDFGDGTKLKKAGLVTHHVYKKPGIYTITLTARKPSERPATVKLKVMVDK
ncbi:PKD domain-containing protein [Sinomicrobium soli]|uniref:PKD domain-containing protein n=1 Tax=Sinomicrobium sp. N-1-3-6 TaxID=2219864 RepID=UPI001374BC59|nr:PKD domain-containing protein [Sinomicrobium sp. N-1-3-6]